MAVNDSPASFGELLRDHRRAVGLTQEELAERAGVSPRSISGLERGDAHIPRRDTVALLVRALRLAGPEREAIEATVDGLRRSRASASVDQVPIQHGRTTGARGAHNLPRSLISIVGRELELVELAGALSTAPLLTLVGSGGVGKTRLAQELVRNQAATYADGSWLVELAGLTDPALVPGAVAAAVGLRDTHTQDMTQTLTEYLKPRHVLLVLDNCEHLADVCAQLVGALLGACPRLQVLATSRQPLAIAGEVIWRVPPLQLPDLQQSQSLEQIASAAAVQLFLERARAVNHALLLNDDNALAIARVCVGLDGIPLALELAAARTRVLTVQQLAERLEYDSGVLRGANRAGLPRHRTIRATIDWSYALLDDRERLLLRRLSVFAGGWTLAAAEQICSGAGIEPRAVLDLLTQLADKSMVLVDATDAAARYRLLEPIRQYAVEQLQAAGEAAPYGARHAAAFLELARTGDAGLAGPNEVSSLDRFEAEHSNFRAGLRWALVHHDGEAALRSAAALFRFWERRGHFQEGCAWLEEALASAGETPARYRARAYNALAFLYWRGGDARRAEPIAEQALAFSREAGKSRDVAQALLNLGMIAFYRGRPRLAVSRLEESVLFGRQAGYLPDLSLALTFLGRTLLWATRGPQNAQAAGVLQESLALAEAAESRYALGHALATLGDLAWRQGDASGAISLWQRSLVIRSQLADRRGLSGSFERLAWGLAASDQFQAAAWLFGAAEAQHNVLGVGLHHDEQIDHAHQVTVVRQHLGADFTAAWSDGRAASLDEATNHALEVTRWLTPA
ncbi:MAG: helix-turn-helix domain-containing protein [Chloroflexota bacterium]|nr:helix-turn-helix domain-containing protein [Chloroflexota bacterium]